MRSNSSSRVGLHQEVVGACDQRLELGGRVAARRDDDDRQPRGGRIGAQRPADAEAVHARHHEVEERQVGFQDKAAGKASSPRPRPFAS